MASVETGPAEVIFVVAASAVKPLEVLVARTEGSPYRLSPFRGYKATGARLVAPVPDTATRPGEPLHRLFPISRERHIGDVSMLSFLAVARRAAADLEGQQLASAVAVAGVEGCGSGARREVVLLIGPEEDRDVGRAREIRRFLAALRVPLRVWVVGGTRSAPQPWSGKPVNDFVVEALLMQRRLGQQRIIWVEGRHPPHLLELSAEARRHVRLLPSAPPG